MTQLALLPDRAVLAITGADARNFLQGIITNDIRKVTPEQGIFSALLSPQGKYLFEFFISEHDDTLLLETDKARLAALIQRFTLYRLRAQVQWVERPDLQVAAAWDGDVTGWKTYTDPRHPALGHRVLYTKDTPLSVNADYEPRRIALGIPEGGKDLIIDRSILLEFGYDHLNAVDFTKGCYVGQEVTARSKHRATLHKYVHQVHAESALPPAGTPVMADGREVGELRSSADTLGLALLRTEDAALSQNLMAGDVLIRAQLPAWVL